MAIVRGQHDPIPKNPEHLASTLRNGRFIEVAGAGHFLPLERPDELVSIVRDAIHAVS